MLQVVFKNGSFGNSRKIPVSLQSLPSPNDCRNLFIGGQLPLLTPVTLSLGTTGAENEWNNQWAFTGGCLLV